MVIFTFLSVFKACTNKFYIQRQCTYIVYLYAFFYSITCKFIYISSGDGSCKHVVAMLLGLEEILEEKGPTEAPMTWHKPKQVGCVPQEVKHLNFKPEAKTSQPHYTYFNPGMKILLRS